MRIGADAIVFSKAGGGTLLSCGMLSQTAQDGVGLLPGPHPGKQPRGGLVAKAPPTRQRLMTITSPRESP